jgi:hypothetical protein
MEDNIYEPLQKKYSLPDFSLLDSEFDLYTLEYECYFLRGIRRKIAEKLESAIKMFDQVLHPEAGFAAYREANTFNEADRENLLNLYRRLMYFHRLSTELDFTNSESADAKFINEFMKEWPNLKKSILSFVVRMKDSWQKDISKKEVVGYLG